MTNIAIVGCGNIGKRHAKWAAKYGTLVAVCDIIDSKMLAISFDYLCSGFTDYKKMLASKKLKIDLVAICTPNGLHVEHTKLALKHGYNVLCEKPMALTTSGGEDMINTAERMNKRLFVVKQNRYNAPILAVKDAIDKGKLGKILSVHLSCVWNRNEDYYKKSTWRGTLKLDGGILFTQFAHFIDLLYYLIGDITEVNTFSENFLHKNITDFPDTIVGAIKFLNGAIGTAQFTTTSTNKNMEGALTIIGEKGTVKIGGQYLNTIEYIEGFKLPVTASNITCNDYGTYKGSSSKHDKVYQNVVGILSGEIRTVASMLDGLKTVQIILRFMGGNK